MFNNKKGFTLIELMIVVAIIGILAAIAIPNFLSYQCKSKQAEAKTNLGAIANSMETYMAEYNTYATEAKEAAWAADKNSELPEIGWQSKGNTKYEYLVEGGTPVNGQNTTFVAEAKGTISGGSDVWRIDNNKNLKNGVTAANLPTAPNCSDDDEGANGCSCN